MFAVLLTCVLAAPGPSPTLGSEAADVSAEYRLKAAFLYNFAKFITWPDEDNRSDGVLRIGVAGATPAVASMKRVIEGQHVRKLRIELEEFDPQADLGRYHIVFVGREYSDAPRLLEKINGRPVLTVGESAEFIPWGGAIRFLLRDGKVRFQIAPGQTDRAGLAISSRLLRLAEPLP